MATLNQNLLAIRQQLVKAARERGDEKRVEALQVSIAAHAEANRLLDKSLGRERRDYPTRPTSY